MSKISYKGSGSALEISKGIYDVITENGFTSDLAASVKRKLGDAEVLIDVYEKYYYRSRNYVSLTVAVFGYGQNVIVDLIASGGSGSLINFSWFAEENFMNAAGSFLIDRGFKETEPKV